MPVRFGRLSYRFESMSNSSNEIALALLATLEVQAKKKGKKSIAKQVAKRLRETGADADVVSQVEGAGGRKSSSATRSSAAKSRGKAKTSAPSTDAARPAA